MLTKDELISQFDVLSTEYIRLLNDKDVLIEWGKPQLEALYATRVGVHQIELLQLQLNIKALKRKLELVRSAINLGELPNFQAIEDLVSEELILAQVQINFQVDAFRQSKEMLSHLSSPTKSAELRKLYRIMAKQLHPDINTNLNEAQTNLWHQVKNAYETGDLDRLKALQIVYEKELNGFEAMKDMLSEEDLLLKVTVLKEGIKVLDEQILAIRSEFPFTIQDQIKDDVWVADKVEEIRSAIQVHQVLHDELITEFTALLNSYDGEF
jgi:hypothetical protein